MNMELSKVEVMDVNNLYNQIEEIIVTKRNKVTYQINNTMLETYFLIGKLIVEYEQKGNIHAEYGKQVLKKLSKRLTKRFGRGFSLSSLKCMRKFYLVYGKQQLIAVKLNDVGQKSQTLSGFLMYDKQKSQPLASQFELLNQNSQTVSGKLSWSHYCYLLSIENDEERSFYEKECINSGWSVRELKRQIDSCLFERLLLSNGKNNKEKVYQLSRVGQTIVKPNDILKEPYVFEFLGIKEDKPILESDLEKSLINNLPNFLMELGRGFMYVGNQKRITLDNNTHYYIDLVFYNKILKSYVLIDLKMTDMRP